MSKEQQPLQLDERTQGAITELEQTITQQYPSATFDVVRAPDDPNSIHLRAIVDVDDPDEVGDLVIDRVVELIAEEGIPIHVIPLPTPERVKAAMQARPRRRMARRTIPILGRLPTP
jgi:hypothetical protein